MHWSGGLVVGAGSGASRRGAMIVASGRDVMTISGLRVVTGWAHVTRSGSLNDCS